MFFQPKSFRLGGHFKIEKHAYQFQYIFPRNRIFSFKIEEGGWGVWAILKHLGWKNIVKLCSNPLELQNIF